MKRVSIIGAAGFLGARLLRGLPARLGEGWAVTGTRHLRGSPDLEPLDVTDARALEAHVARGFDHVVVAAGTKDVAACEADPAGAVALHARPVEVLAAAAARQGLPAGILLLSTDYVFDGERGLYRDDDAVAPRTAYGRSKALAERALLDAPGRHVVVRSAAVLGRGARFLDWLLGELSAGRQVPLFEDCHGSPTAADLLVDAIAAVLLGWEALPRRVLHAVGDRRMSRFELGRLVASLAPGARADLVVPARRGEVGPLFQSDLSLVPSDVLLARPREPLEEHLRRELGGGRAGDEGAAAGWDRGGS